MQAMILTLPPQASQVAMSILNTHLKLPAHAEVECILASAKGR